MSYEVIVERKARKAIARLPSGVYSRDVQMIDDLANDPRPPPSRQLRGWPGRRLRVGDYRIVYDMDDESRRAYVAEVWHRQRDSR